MALEVLYGQFSRQTDVARLLFLAIVFSCFSVNSVTISLFTSLTRTIHCGHFPFHCSNASAAVRAGHRHAGAAAGHPGGGRAGGASARRGPRLHPERGEAARRVFLLIFICGPRRASITIRPRHTHWVNFYRRLGLKAQPPHAHSDLTTSPLCQLFLEAIPAALHQQNNHFSCHHDVRKNKVGSERQDV